MSHQGIYNDATISSTHILAQLHCDQRSVEASASLIAIDSAKLEVIMRKYGKDNFLKGEKFLTGERTRLLNKHATVTGRMDSIQQHMDSSLSLAHNVQTARNIMSSPPNVHSSVERSTILRSIASSPIPHQSTIPLSESTVEDLRSPRAHRIPTIADSRILSNSSSFMKGGS